MSTEQRSPWQSINKPAIQSLDQASANLHGVSYEAWSEALIIYLIVQKSIFFKISMKNSH